MPLRSVNELNETIKKRSAQMTPKMKFDSPRWEGAIFEKYRRKYYSREQWEKDI